MSGIVDIEYLLMILMNYYGLLMQGVSASAK